METGLRGKRVLVTGASGGIGSACVRSFLDEGAQVVAHYHGGRERAEALGDVQLVQADLTREEDADRLFAEAGELDVCAAVAGVWPREDVPVWELSLERWEQTLRENLTSTFLTARAFLRGVARLGEGTSSSPARPPGSSARPAMRITLPPSPPSSMACFSASRTRSSASRRAPGSMRSVPAGRDRR